LKEPFTLTNLKVEFPLLVMVPVQYVAAEFVSTSILVIRKSNFDLLEDKLLLE